jgi:protein-L-isoaspartate(D-aspartate) O-methyltransferase
VRALERHGYLKSERIVAALLKVRREEFIPRHYRDYAYREVPLPLPGERATISCPHSYPLFYEPLGLDRGHRFLEVGSGSGYGAAVAREVVCADGLVVSVEIDPETYAFAMENLQRAGYREVHVVRGDGGLGWPELAPYDRISVTAACVEIPAPLVEQLTPDGRLISPVTAEEDQDLVLVERRGDRVETSVLCKVLYVPLQGTYG